MYQRHLSVAGSLVDRALSTDIVVTRESVSVVLFRVHLAAGAKIPGLDILIAHDTATDHGDRAILSIFAKGLSALTAVDHFFPRSAKAYRVRRDPVPTGFLFPRYKATLLLEWYPFQYDVTVTDHYEHVL